MANSKLSNHYGFVKPNDIRALSLMNAAAQHTMHVLSDIVLGYGHSDEYSFVFHKSCTLFERRAAKISSTVVSTFTSAYVHLWPNYFSAPPLQDTFFKLIAKPSHPNDIGHATDSKVDKQSLVTEAGAQPINDLEGAVNAMQGETFQLAQPPSSLQPQELPSAAQLPKPLTNSSANLRTDEMSSSTTSLSLSCLPTFDARCICYPTNRNLRDYISWRQADCHVNNLYNTSFWALVLLGGMTNTAAEESLKGTVSSDKNEILFSKFGINYNNEREIFRKGSVVVRNYEPLSDQGIADDVRDRRAFDEDEAMEPNLSKTQREKLKKAKKKAGVVIMHCDVIQDEFWLKRPWILTGKQGKIREDSASKE